MKNKIFDLVVVLGCVLVLFELLFNRVLVFDTISYSLEVWVSSIIPSLFPFFVVSDILISYDVTRYIPRVIKRLLGWLFNASENVVALFLLSVVSGFPSNARNVRTMYDKGIIDGEEASYALVFTHFSNPLFIIGTVGTFFFKNVVWGIIILISHYLGNVLLGFLFRGCSCSTVINYNGNGKKCQKFPVIFIGAVKRSIDSLLMIWGMLCCFLVLGSIIINMLNISSYDAVILKGILEFTMGIRNLALLDIDAVYKVVMATMFISFGGLSVHMQVLSFLVDTDISYKFFLVARILHTAISGIIALMMFGIYNII